MSRAIPAVAFLLAALTIQSCGGAPSAARAALDGTTRVLVQVDVVVAQEYTRQAAAALAEAGSLEAYREAMQPLDAAEQGLRGAASGLRAMEAALDAWDDGDDGAAWYQVVPCAVRSFAHLAELLVIAGVPVPDELSDVIATLSALVGGACVEG